MAEDLKLSKALFEALNTDNLELAEILLKRGANPNIILAVEGVAPVHLAAGLGERAVKLLITYGGDPNVRSADGTTPLHVAATWGDTSALHLLLLNGGDPYIMDQEGVNALQSAQNYGHSGCVALLEYFCLLLNPDEDAVSSDPKYTYQFKGSLGDLGIQRTNEEDNEEMYMNDFGTSPIKTKLSDKQFYQREFQKRFKRFDGKRNVILDVTSPDHPLIKHKRVNRSPEEPSLHVHWAEKLAQTLPHIPKSSEDLSSSLSDTFITCSGEQEDPKNKFFSSDIYESSRISPVANSEIPVSKSSNITPTNHVISSSNCQNSTFTKNSGCKKDLISQPYQQKPVQLTNQRTPFNFEDSLISSDESYLKSKYPNKNSNATCRNPLNNSDVFEDYNFSEFDSIISENKNENNVSKKRVSFAANDRCKSVTDMHVDKVFLMDKLRQSLNSCNSVKSSESCGENDILNQSFCWPRHSLDSSLSDTSTIDYIYTDKEKGIQLIERHLPSLQGSTGSGRQSIESMSSVNTIDSQQTIIYDWKAFSDSSTCTEDTPVRSVDLPSSIKALDNLQLREELKNKGDNPGPINQQTRQLYLTRLAKIHADPGYLKLCRCPPAYSPELMEAINNKFNKSGLDELEGKLLTSFSDNTRCWREGTLKSSFNYLLLDPRVTQNLPNRMHSLGELESFKVFVASIFYVGKGKRSRPYCHLYEAIRQIEKPKPQVCDKVKHILDIWNENLGVVSLHCFQNVIPVEAYTREACIVDAISLNRLTNKKRGDYYGVSTTWNMKEKRRMGVYFLRKAMQIFQGEGERQILPVDIKVGQ